MGRHRLEPTLEQDRALLDHCAQARFVWNLGLEQRNLYRSHLGSTPDLTEQCRQLTEARANNEWLASGVAQIQQQALRDLDQAFKNWWRKPQHFGRPTWRKKDLHEGFRIVQIKPGHVIRLSKRWGTVKISKVGQVRFRWHRRPEDCKSIRVKRDPVGTVVDQFRRHPRPAAESG